MRTILLSLVATLLLIPALLSAQDRMASRDGEITFYSSTPMEDIEAVNRKVASVYVPSTGAIEFSALIKAFAFEKAMMQEHFNENYMESKTFPKAIFKGKVTAAEGADLSQVGTHAVLVEGDLTIHGVTKHIIVMGTLTTSNDGRIKAESDFDVKPEDFGIKVPGVVRSKIAELVQVKVRLEYAKL